MLKISIKQEKMMVNGVEKDPIIAERPVYLSRKLDKQLYVFQYPLLLNSGKCLPIKKMCFKPKNKEVKVELSVNRRSTNFDRVRSEKLIRIMNVIERKRNKAFENNIVESIIYNSSKVLFDTSTYAIVACDGKSIHFTPLEGYLKLRPSLNYLDTVMNFRGGDGACGDEETAQQKALHAIMVKFAKGEIDKNLMPKELSYHQLKERSNSERWIECKWHPSNTGPSYVARQKLFTRHHGNTLRMLHPFTDSEYVKQLVPDDEEHKVVHPALPSHVVAFNTLKAMPVLDQCRVLLKDTKLMQLQQIMSFLITGNGITPEGVLKCLPQIAVLVRGNWVVKSDILYPKNSHSAVSGVSAGQMCNARDYLLYLFTKQEFIERRRVGQQIGLPAEEIKEVFTGISKLKHNKGWELLLPEDRHFIAQYADIVERQKRLWDRRWLQLSGVYKSAPKVERVRRKSRNNHHILNDRDIRVKH